MNQVKRIFVEKRPEHAVVADALRQDVKTTLGIRSLERVRVVNRYDVQNLPEDAWGRAVDTILSEPAVDDVTDELTIDTPFAFAVEYLPGQYDQRADSAAQCMALITEGDQPLVRNATIYLLYGTLSDEEFAAVKKFMINPVDSREASMALPETLKMALPVPADVAVMEGFSALDDKGIEALYATLGLAMTATDLAFVRNYFRDEEKRDPSLTEIRVIDTYWSDHCRHTTFQTQLTDVRFDKGAELVEAAWKEYLATRDAVYAGRKAKPICLMDLATITVKDQKLRGLLDDLDESDEINACSIVRDVDVDGEIQQWLIQFKNETHNHPTEIEPFGGAATCLGGAIRDPLSGRSYVYQAMRVTGSADPRAHIKDTLPGKLPQRKITQGAAHGYSSYGNQIGLATGQVTEIYDPGYVAKRMEIGAVVGAVRRDVVRREVPDPGDVIILLGGRTGRDGIGGATGSSKAHTGKSIETCGAEVQKGNAPTERKLQRLYRDPEVVAMIKRCNDFGAGGVCVAIGELSDGLDIDLDKVPRKYDGLDGTELAISESQERMAVVVEKENVQRFIALAAGENLEATPVAVVTDTGRMRMNWRGKEILNISRAFLDTNGAAQYAQARVTAPDPEPFFHSPDGVEEFRSWMGDLNVCSQRGLSERFDASIGAGTVLMPFGGKYQLTPPMVMAAKIPLEKGETHTCTLMSHGYYPALSRRSPYHGAVYAVVESLARIAAGGGDIATCRLTFQEYFERLRTEETRWGKPLSALLGAMTAQQRLSVASIGGKDSMSGSFDELDVPPTLVSFAICTEKTEHVLSSELKGAGHDLMVLRLPRDGQGMPDFEQFKRNCAALYRAIGEGVVLSAHTVGLGGIACAVGRMCMGNMVGARLIKTSGLLDANVGDIVFEVKDHTKLNDLFTDIPCTAVGITCAEKELEIYGETLALADLRTLWETPLQKVFPMGKEVTGQIRSKIYTGRSQAKPAVKVAKPRVFIPVFPGTNCEYDAARAFERAGAVAQTVVMKNMTPAAIAQSIEEMERVIDNSQIIMLPGGFSAGDEPEGSGKFIATVLRAPRVAAAIGRLLNERDGLALGICNGFQALIKLGLVPYGEIRDMRADSPTITFNAIGRHQSRIVHTKVVSVKSPWFLLSQPGDVVEVAISHGEGRFACTEEEFGRLLENGQIATQYIDAQGQPTFDPDYNPNASLHAVEGILSPDGRVLGKMGHNERSGEGLYRNVPGQYDSRIFESGVKYFG
ncbi:MAG: phosphoribosylformylglycinamidine synthase [Eubacteriales bacterium]|nr:phosphoribosylformylglycinamidine synthase [Eubacteriales bacterium]